VWQSSRPWQASDGFVKFQGVNEKPSETDSDGGITRAGLEAVIRRAAELYAAQADADEHISEEELLRIGGELGLPARLVRQALLEVGTEPAPPQSFLDRALGRTAITATRSVPSEADTSLSRLEHHLAIREYLQVQRRKPGRILLVPADDTVSRIARVFSRPSKRFHVARSQRVEVGVRTLEAGWSHVRIDVDLSAQRKDAVTVSAVTGTMGTALGVTLAGLIAGPELAAGTLGAGSAFAAIGTLVATSGASFAGALALGRSAFRSRKVAARLELETLLDRLESGGPLDPPPSPWRRRLQSRFAGLLGPGR